MAKQIYINGNIITMNDAQPTAEAIGIAGDKIAVVGSNEEVKAWGGDDTQVVDIGGKTVIPGLIESHNHISLGAIWQSHANCSSVKCATIEDVLNSVSEHLAEMKPGTWIQGLGYDDTAIAEMRHLTRHDLDLVTTENPIFISHVSGHLCYLNTKAL
ncbi:MAG: amidohydrolase family protein, partial [Chloroflexota bacterium]